jgi:hypothetical protein
MVTKITPKKERNTTLYHLHTYDFRQRLVIAENINTRYTGFKMGVGWGGSA